MLAVPAKLLAALVVLAALLAVRGAAAFERLPALGRAIEALPFATCRVSPEAQGSGWSASSSSDGPSVLDVDPPPPALALPRARSGPDAKPGANDTVVGTDGLVLLREPAARRFDQEAAARAAALRERRVISRGCSTAHPARGPPVPASAYT